MEILTGIDIIEVGRIKESIEELGKEFLEKIYADQEIVYCEKRKVQKYQSYAARFAAKEAIFKAISKKLDNKYEVSFKDAYILNDKFGRPYVEFSGKLKRIFETKEEKVVSMDISLSHIKETAVANFNLILLKKEDIK